MIGVIVAILALGWAVYINYPDSPLPTNTPIPDAEVSVRVASLHSEPNPSSKVDVILNEGTKVELLAITDDRTWLFVDTWEGGKGWLEAYKLKLNSSANELAVVKSKVEMLADAELYLKPDIFSSTVITVHEGDEVELLAVNSDKTWVRVRAFQYAEGWIQANNLELTNVYLDTLPVINE